jgi:hypothetical protein
MSTYLGKKRPEASVNDLISSMVDRHRDGIYDRARLAAGVPTPRTIDFFQKGLCPENPEKSWADTNLMGSGGQMQSPYDVIVRRFLMVFQPGGSRVDEHRFLRNYVWELWVIHKRLQLHPLLEFSVKGNIADVIRQFGSEDCKGTLERFAVPYAYNLCDLARYIPPLVSFGVSLVGESFVPQQDMDLYSVLDGSVDWPVA